MHGVCAVFVCELYCDGTRVVVSVRGRCTAHVLVAAFNDGWRVRSYIYMHATDACIEARTYGYASMIDGAGAAAARPG